MGLLDISDALNVVERALGLVAAVAGADWKAAASRGGLAGVGGEALRTLAGANSWTFRVPKACAWSGSSIERLLRHYGIRMWNRGVGDTELHFTVEKRQANWAEYLLLRRGIPVAGPLFNPRNMALGERHAPGDRPPAWEDRKGERGFWDGLLDLL